MSNPTKGNLMKVGQEVTIRTGSSDEYDGRRAIVEKINSPLACTIYVPSLRVRYSESNSVLEAVETPVEKYQKRS